MDIYTFIVLRNRHMYNKKKKNSNTQHKAYGNTYLTFTECKHTQKKHVIKKNKIKKNYEI